MSIHQIDLPLPPSANVYWRMMRGRTVVSPQVRDYRVVVAHRCATMTPLAGRVRLTLHVFMGRRTGDLSNRLKVLEDALQGYAYTDDGQVAEIHMYKHYDKANPRVEVDVREI